MEGVSANLTDLGFYLIGGVVILIVLDHSVQTWTDLDGEYWICNGFVLELFYSPWTFRVSPWDLWDGMVLLSVCNYRAEIS